MTETIDQAAERFVGICRLERKVPLPKETVKDIQCDLVIPIGCTELTECEQEFVSAKGGWEVVMYCSKYSKAGIDYLQDEYDRFSQLKTIYDISYSASIAVVGGLFGWIGAGIRGVAALVGGGQFLVDILPNDSDTYASNMENAIVCKARVEESFYRKKSYKISKYNSGGLSTDYMVQKW